MEELKTRAGEQMGENERLRKEVISISILKVARISNTILKLESTNRQAEEEKERAEKVCGKLMATMLVMKNDNNDK